MTDPRIEVRQIVALHLTGQLRNLALAASALNTTQPTVSRLIRGAEAELGVALFRRGWSGVEPTAAGEAVAGPCGAIVAAIDATEAAVFGAGGPHLHPHPRLRMAVRWGQLAAIRAVAECGSVTAAAAMLGCGQPEVSRALSQTADHLGLTLFQRGRAGMTALPAAQALARLHATALYHARQIPIRLAARAGDVTGRVAVGMLPFAGQSFIAQAFARLGNLHPGLRLVCVPGSYPSLTEALRRYEIDCMLGILRGADLAADLTEQPLYDEAFTIVARHDHPMQARARTLSDLAQTPWLVAPHGTPVRRYFEAQFAALGQTPPIQTCEMLAFGLAEQMLVESNALGMLTYGAAHLVRLRPELGVVRVALPDARAPIGLTRLTQAAPEPGLTAFVQVLGQVLDGGGAIRRAAGSEPHPVA